MSLPAGYGPTGSGKQKGLTGYQQASMSRLSPEQQQLFQALLGGSMGGLENGLQSLSGLAGGDEEAFRKLEAPALRQFGQLQGNIASRFSGMGSGARRSSGFQNALGGAATDFAERLQSQRMGLQQNAIAQLLGLSESLLGRDTQENFLVPKQKPAWQELLMSLVPGLGQGLGTAGSLYAGKRFGIF